ncbi:sulfite exporter TauE/SafE family protein [Bacillus licheniformis]|uniref:sulfite exporter TauE/SafE family protein n=1 Tax=Bacillus licheniformis TaxID=1402 RepID=UPI002ED987D4
MDISFILLIFFIGFIGSFMSGMLGVGGAIINYPLLLYIPALLGFTGFNAHQVSGIVAVQVFIAAFSGVWAYRKDGYLNKELIFIMGLSILLGSLIGGYGSHFFSEDAINMVYGLLAIIAAIIMLIPKTGTEGNQSDHIRFPKILTSIMTFVVGLASGIVGAGGAFLLVPLMLVIIKIPARITIATSLAVTFISLIGTTATKLVIGQVPIMPALVVMAASLIASPLGVFIGKKVNAKVLQGILIFVIFLTTVKIWVDILLY